MLGALLGAFLFHYFFLPFSPFSFLLLLSPPLPPRFLPGSCFLFSLFSSLLLFLFSLFSSLLLFFFVGCSESDFLNVSNLLRFHLTFLTTNSFFRLGGISLGGLFSFFFLPFGFSFSFFFFFSSFFLFLFLLFFFFFFFFFLCFSFSFLRASSPSWMMFMSSADQQECSKCSGCWNTS